MQKEEIENILQLLSAEPANADKVAAKYHHALLVHFDSIHERLQSMEIKPAVKDAIAQILGMDTRDLNDASALQDMELQWMQAANEFDNMNTKGTNVARIYQKLYATLNRIMRDPGP